MKHSEQASPALLRALQLDSLQRSGCSFRLGDFFPAEWLGLEALREGREIMAKEARENTEKEM